MIPRSTIRATPLVCHYVRIGGLLFIGAIAALHDEPAIAHEAASTASSSAASPRITVTDYAGDAISVVSMRHENGSAPHTNIEVRIDVRGELVRHGEVVGYLQLQGGSARPEQGTAARVFIDGTSIGRTFPMSIPRPTVRIPGAEYEVRVEASLATIVEGVDGEPAFSRLALTTIGQEWVRFAEAASVPCPAVEFERIMAPDRGECPILFKTGESDLFSAQYGGRNRAIVREAMRSLRGICIEQRLYSVVITGWASTTKYADNEGLARSRAEAVKNYLAQQTLSECLSTQPGNALSNLFVIDPLGNQVTDRFGVRASDHGANQCAQIRLVRCLR